jgi:hypothetical protein
MTILWRMGSAFEERGRLGCAMERPRAIGSDDSSEALESTPASELPTLWKYSKPSTLLTSPVSPFSLQNFALLAK